jgi:hypothetical protein
MRANCLLTVEAGLLVFALKKKNQVAQVFPP